MEVVFSKEIYGDCSENLKNMIDKGKKIKSGFSDEERLPTETSKALLDFNLYINDRILFFCENGGIMNAIGCLKQIHDSIIKCYEFSDSPEELKDILIKKLGNQGLLAKIAGMNNPSIKDDGDNIVVYDLGIVK